MYIGTVTLIVNIFQIYFWENIDFSLLNFIIQLIHFTISFIPTNNGLASVARTKCSGHVVDKL